MNTSIKKGIQILSAIMLISILSCSQEQKRLSEITWDTWGVPHIYATDDDQLFYAQGWAQMQLHGDLILSLFGRARGRAAEYWGKDYETESKLIQTLGFPALAKTWSENQDPRLKKIITAFARGMNDYAMQHPSSFQQDKNVVLPIVYDDINLHYMHVIYAVFMAGDDIGGILNLGVGSNAWAIAPSRSAGKKSMLVQNPHLPWWGEFTWAEMHLRTDSINAYGATLVGLPALPIAFNEKLGWTHTVNTIDVVDTYELDLVEDGYMLDGKKTSFEKSTGKLSVKDSNGKLEEKKIDLLRTVHGPVLRKVNHKAYAVRISGLDAPNGMLQWWEMAKASTFEEFEAALKMAQIPYFNVLYADKPGNIFYLSNGLIPKRKEQEWRYWNRMIPGGRSEDIWNSVHTYEELPKVKNPPQGWLQNANDPPWSCTFPMMLKRSDYPGYMSPDGMSFRPQRSVRMLFEDESITYDELISYKMSTRMELADRVLDDLFAAVDRFGSPISREAKAVLEKWDRQADINSKGAQLFYKWRLKMFGASGDMFAVQWSDTDPRLTPDGLSDPKTAVRMLEEASAEMKKENGSLDVSWGDVHRLKMDSIDLPASGGDDFLGIFRVAWSGQDGNVMGGDSWVGIIEFGDRVRANVLLSYGNSSQKGSLNRGDQLKLFSEKKLRLAAFYPDDVAKAMVSKETLTMPGVE